jgi:hypothetical protein
MSVVSFDHFQKLELPLSEMVSGRIGYIHDLFLRFPYEIHDHLPAGGRDLVVLMNKEDRQEKLAALAAYPGRVLLIVAPGDASFRASYMPDRRALPINIVAVYACNNEHSDRRVFTLPLGVRTSNLRTLQFVRQNHKGGRDHLLYGNFTVNKHQYHPHLPHTAHIRERLAEQLQGQRWLTLDVSSEHRRDPESLLSFYSNLASHRFVLAPEGNGVDCYRTWESLYLGAIPIVMRSTGTSAFSGLPILFTEDYSELSERYLEACWAEMSKRRFDLRHMMKSSYFQHFLASLGELTNPRFVCWGFRGTPAERMHEVLQSSSRSPSDVFSITPIPPFFPMGIDPLDPRNWSVNSGLHATSDGQAIHFSMMSDAGASAKLPLETIAGATFTITARVRAAHIQAGKLLFRVQDREGACGETEADAAADKQHMSLSFVARHDRTQLLIAPLDASAGDKWILRDLSVNAEV